MTAAPGEGRPGPTKGGLSRLGFREPEQALDHLDRIAAAADPLLALLARTPDPDLALAALVRVTEHAGPEESERLLAALVDDEGTAMRLLSVLGASDALGDHLCRHPEHWRELTDPTLGSTRPAAYAVREGLLRAVGADPHDDAAGGDGAGPRGGRRAAGRVPPRPAPARRRAT